MSLSSEDHVALLLSCISNKENGKIDFEAVAKECNIKTSGAAAKRYSRLITAHKAAKANSAAGENDSNDAGQSTPATTTATASPAKNPRKRKTPVTATASAAQPARKSRARAAKSRAVPNKDESGSEGDGENGNEDEDEDEMVENGDENGVLVAVKEEKRHDVQGVAHADAVAVAADGEDNGETTIGVKCEIDACSNGEDDAEDGYC